MQYKINTKAFHEAFKEPKDSFYKNWSCPIHGPKDHCSHYTEALAKFTHDFMQKFIEPCTETQTSLKPIGLHVAKRLVAPAGYEYGWKTLYRAIEIFKTGTSDCDVNAVRRRTVDFELDKDALLGLGADGWMPLGYIDDSYKIPKNEDGFYADGDAVLCMRIKHEAKPWDSITGTLAEKAMKEEGGKTAHIDDGIETIVDDTYYSSANKRKDMPHLPALDNELGATDEQVEGIIEHAKKHIVPGWEDNEANRIARSAIDNMNRMEQESFKKLMDLGLKRQGETVDPRDEYIANRFDSYEYKEENLISSDEIEQMCKEKGLDYTNLSGDDCQLICNEIMSNRKLAKVYSSIHADPVPVESATHEFKGFDFEAINKDEEKNLKHLRYIAYLKAINSKQFDEGFSFDEAYDIVGKDYPEFRSEEPITSVAVESTSETEPYINMGLGFATLLDNSEQSKSTASAYLKAACDRLGMIEMKGSELDALVKHHWEKGFTYTGVDADVWAPIMENMGANIAKANALEKAKETFPSDALTLIMGYHFGKNTSEWMDNERIDFVEKYRRLITEMGYSRF